MDCENCGVESRLRVLELELGHNQQAHKEFFSRLEKLERQNAVTDERYQQILAGLSEVKADVRDLKEKPARRWEQAMGLVLEWAVLGLLAASLLFPR